MLGVRLVRLSAVPTLKVEANEIYFVEGSNSKNQDKKEWDISYFLPLLYCQFTEKDVILCIH